MRDTGIVRRIDDLGRVVIPKEIRKTLRIKEGDPLEIFTNKDELLFKKYSPLTSEMDLANSLGQSLSETSDKNCIITETDTVVFSSYKPKELIGKTISKDLEKVMKERMETTNCRTDGRSCIGLYQGDENSCENQIIVPIITNGDCYGAVILWDGDLSCRFSSSDLKLVKLASQILAKQFE